MSLSVLQHLNLYSLDVGLLVHKKMTEAQNEFKPGAMEESWFESRLHRLNVLSGAYGMDPGERQLFFTSAVAMSALILYGMATYLPPYLQRVWSSTFG